MKKSIKDISLDITEDEYRKDGCIHYSTLGTYLRTGFNGLATLFDKKESTSLTFGSCVDAIITGGYEEFESRFYVANIPNNISDILIKITDCLFEKYSNEHDHLASIPSLAIKSTANDFGYGQTWKVETVVNKLLDACADYYDAKFRAKGKEIISPEMYSDVLNTVNALRTSEATKFYFADDNPFEPDIERKYQLKFRATFNKLDYSCMSDLIVVNHKDKIVYPIDLKTSSHTEWDFYKSFVEWCYHVQARQYWRIIRDTMDKDDYFKDFKLDDYRFIVANKSTLTPLVWVYEDTTKYGDLKYKDGKLTFRDPFSVAEELTYYLNNNSKVPNEINIKEDNSITKWLNK